MSVGIRQRVLLLALGPALVIALVLGIYFISIQMRNLENALIERGAALTRHLAQASEYGVFAGNKAVLQRLIDQIFSEKDVRAVQLSDVAGNVLIVRGSLTALTSTSTQMIGMETSPDGRALVFHAPVTQLIEQNADVFEQELLGGKQEQLGKPVLGWVHLELSRDSTMAMQQIALVRTSLITVLVLFLGYVAARQLGVSITEPVLVLRDTLERLASGDMGARAKSGASAELHTLETGINAMAVALQMAQDNLRQEINEATTELRETLQALELKNHELDIERERAEEANKSKSRFLANMSHELRTPLNAIIGYSEMMEEDAAESGNAQFVEDLQKVNAAGKHLLGLINDILDLSKVEAGRMTLYMETAEISSLMQYTQSTIRPLAFQNHNNFEVKYPDDIGAMHVDVTKLRQVLFNLLSNACKFTDHGMVGLEARRLRHDDGKDWIMFIVRDTGMGMSEAQIAWVFESFVQADASISREYGGTGLGLALCKRFVELMGGTLEVQSVLGEGSVFTACFPVEGIAPVPIKDGSQRETARQSSERLNFNDGPVATVLVIDDDELVHDMLRRTLSKEGFEVRSAYDGEAGLESAIAEMPDVIVLDVLMPGMDGWTVLAKIKEDPAISQIPVIMLSMVDDHTRGYALGVTEFLTKPVDRNRLLETLRRCVVEGPSMPVLVVEDDQRHRQMIKRLLEGENWSVMVAHNGQIALDSIRARRPAVIILDLLMPELDGFELIKILRAQPDTCDIPVLVLTSKDLTREERALLDGNVDEIMQKGGGYDELLEKVKKMVCTNTSLT